MHIPTRWLQALGNLFYPRLCLACADNQPPRHALLCVACQLQLPRTDYHLYQENTLTERFWGRVPLISGTAMYHFVKGGRAQHLLHQLKYEGKKDIGTLLGQWYGKELINSPWYRSVDAIVPVPLHPRRERQRGYNQSDVFAAGLAQSMHIPWIKTALARKIHTDTQTRKGRLDRFGNVAEVFEVRRPNLLQDKHLLLVDDVMTTGATLEACANGLLQVPGVTLSIATIGIAT
jgi:ComF family protein